MIKFENLERQDGNWGDIWKDIMTGRIYAAYCQSFPDYKFGKDYFLSETTEEDDNGRRWVEVCFK